MQDELSEEEQELVKNYRKACDEDQEAISWAAEVAARVQDKLGKGERR
jgi:hypothetical protein